MHLGGPLGPARPADFLPTSWLRLSVLSLGEDNLGLISLLPVFVTGIFPTLESD